MKVFSERFVKMDDAIWVKFHSNQAECLLCFITVDETWVHHFTLERKEQSKQWIQKWKIGSKEDEDRSICMQSHGVSFWGICVGYASLTFLKMEKLSTASIMQTYCNVRWNKSGKNDSIRLRKSVVSSTQCTSSQIRYCNSQN